MTKLDQLPSELVSMILSYIRRWDLPSCALINKFFYKEAMSHLWYSIVIYHRTAYNVFTRCLKQSPNAAGHHVRSLHLANCWDLFTPDASLLEVLQYVPNLELLSTCMGHIMDDASLQQLPRYCPHLTSLEIWCDSSPDQGDSMPHAIMVAIGIHCKLSKLVLSECAYLNYDRLWGALEHAPLTTVRLTLPRQVDTQVALRFAETAPLALHRYPLTTLSIGCLLDDSTNFIHFINTHGLTWPHLTSFDLTRCDSLTDAMALSFVQAHPTLEDLSLDLCNLTDTFLDGLVDYLPNLTMLNVESNSGITAPGICRLIKDYGGRLDGVNCDDCDIYLEDLPNDKTSGYRMARGDDPQVQWFDGTFHDISNSEQDTQDHEDQP